MVPSRFTQDETTISPSRSNALAIFSAMAILFTTSCAETNSLIGDHQNAAYNYRTTAQALEKSAKKESDLQNHIVAAMKLIDASKSRIASAEEYQKLGNPVWTKNMFEKSSVDLDAAANEIRATQEAQAH